MTTKDQLIAARADLWRAEKNSPLMADRKITLDNISFDTLSTIRTLLDEDISKMETVEQTSNSRELDLDGLKRECKKYPYECYRVPCHVPNKCADTEFNRGWNSAIDHLAAQGRILPEGWVAVDKTIYKIFENACNTLQGRMNIFSAQKKED